MLLTDDTKGTVVTLERGFCTNLWPRNQSDGQRVVGSYRQNQWCDDDLWTAHGILSDLSFMFLYFLYYHKYLISNKVTLS